MTDKQAIDTHSDGLRRGEPREAGVNAAIVAAFLDNAAAAGLDIHGLMLHRAGRVVAEGWRWPYRADRPRIMHSATKSVMACAIAMALEEGRLRHGYHWTTMAGVAYAAIGIFMQFVMVFPDHQATLAVVGATQEGSRVYRPVVQRHFPRAFEEPLSANEAQEADARLRSRLVAAGEQPPMATCSSKTAVRISGKTFRIEPNPLGVTAVRFVFANDRCVFHLDDTAGNHGVVCGLRDWIESRTDVPGPQLSGKKA